MKERKLIRELIQSGYHSIIEAMQELRFDPRAKGEYIKTINQSSSIFRITVKENFVDPKRPEIAPFTKTTIGFVPSKNEEYETIIKSLGELSMIY